MRRSSMTAASTLLALLAVSHLSGCVMKSRYNTMLQQQQALESSLRVEINADQVKIEQLENGIRVRVANELLYRSGSVELHPNGRAALDKVAGQLADMAAHGNRIDVVGNTDDVPVGRELEARYPTNWELAVVRHLQKSGVDPTKLDAKSCGQYDPVASNATAAGRAQNRRTELFIRPPE